MARIFTAAGTVTEVAPANGTAFSLAELQAVVGGYIEAVYLNDGSVMMINEEGKLQGLPYNTQATRIAHGNRALFVEDYISGDVIVLTRAEAGEDEEEDE